MKTTKNILVALYLLLVWAVCCLVHLPVGLWRALKRSSSDPLPDWVTEEEKEKILNER